MFRSVRPSRRCGIRLSNQNSEIDINTAFSVVFIVQWVQKDFGQIEESRIKERQNANRQDGKNTQFGVPN